MSPLPVRPGRVRAGVAVLLAGVLTLLLSACGSTSVASIVREKAITVDGTSISRKSFDRDVGALAANVKLKALDQSVASQGSTSARLFDTSGHATRNLTTSWLNRLVNQVVVDREFTSMHLKVTPTDVTEGKSQFAQLFATQSDNGAALVKAFPAWFVKQEDAREARLVAVARVLEAKHPITEAQMRAYYTKNVGSLCPTGFEVAHILVKTQPEAQAIESQLAAGAKFADLAKQKSTDTGSAKNGGALGCLSAGEFVAEFQTAADKATVNVPTAPVHSQFGWHIILKTKFVPPSFQSLEPQIRQQILQTLNLVQQFVAARLKKASVKVDPVLGTWNPKTFRVDAPKVPAVRDSRHGSSTSTSTPPTT
jgi:PPIC-type PPIASE domain/SurA N-terminal domain